MVSPLPNTMRRPRAVGLAFAVVGLLVWGVAMQPIKDREGGGVLALGGRRLMEKYNNQPKVGGSGRGEYWGGRLGCIFL